MSELVPHPTDRLVPEPARPAQCRAGPGHHQLKSCATIEAQYCSPSPKLEMFGLANRAGRLPPAARPSVFRTFGRAPACAEAARGPTVWRAAYNSGLCRGGLHAFTGIEASQITTRSQPCSSVTLGQPAHAHARARSKRTPTARSSSMVPPHALRSTPQSLVQISQFNSIQSPQSTEYLPVHLFPC